MATGVRGLFIQSLYLTVGLASVMLWAAEGPFSQAALTIPVAVAAYLYVERRGATLPGFAANGLGLVAVGAALLELWLRDIEGRLLFGAHLLVYLTWILLWLPKTSRQRWGLLALAVLQVGVGSVLTNSGLYGLGLAAFLTLTVWTLLLLQLDEAEARHAPAALPPVGAGDRPAALLLGRGAVSPAGGATFGRWPMRQIAAAVAVTVAGAVAVGAAFFLLIPRIEVGRRGFEEADSPLARQRTTGFTEEVRLGEFGQILESSVPVFEVRVYDDGDDSPMDVTTYAQSMGYEEPLFRGMTLTRYEAGRWTSGQARDLGYLLEGGPRRVPKVRQEYRIQPTTSDALFAISPVYAGHIIGAEERIRFRARTGALSRPRARDRRYTGELTYVVFSPRNATEVGGRPGRFSTYDYPPSSLGADPADDPYLQLPEGMDRLREIAGEVARPEGGEADARVRAERLDAWLRETGGFAYSLSGEIDDPSLDPVEDFLINRKAGHCEYFASALALMLRAEGIPCRVVSGFKGGEVNRLSRAFEVQQRHAHTWVEAYLGNRWETLDPTPASQRNRSVAENASWLPLLSDLRSAASWFWRVYVVQMNITQQRRTLAPLREAVTVGAAALRENWWPALKRQVYALATDPSRWFSWQGGVATFLLLLFGVGSWRLSRWLKRRLAKARAARKASARRGRRVEFYERFRRLCERRGWRPGPGQTPREFAAGVAGAEALRSLPPRLALLPGELTEDFYRVRFGETDLPESQVDELGERLGELEAALANGSPR